MTRLGLFLMNRRGDAALEKLISARGPESVAYVVTAEDDQLLDDYSERIGKTCRQHGIECIEREAYSPSGISEDYKVAIGWRWLIEPCNNLIVLHDSPLPAYRGFAPLVNMLVNGEPEMAVTAIEAAQDYDAGDILLQKRKTVDYPVKIADAIEMVSQIYSAMLVDLHDSLADGAITGQPQDESKATYSPWLDSEDYSIDWSWSADRIERFVNAVGRPYLGARTLLNDQVIIIDEVSAMPDIAVIDRPRHVGKIIRMDEGRHVVICGNGLVRLDSIRLHDGSLPVISFRSRFR